MLFLTDMALSIVSCFENVFLFWGPLYTNYIPSCQEAQAISLESLVAQGKWKKNILRFNLPISRIPRLLDSSHFTTSITTFARWPIKVHWVIDLIYSYLTQISNTHWELKQLLDKLSVIQFLFSLLIPPFLSQIDCFLDKGVYEIRLKS